jgi:hypothetical protein
MKKNETTWQDVDLNEFMSCPSNLAFNRQTWMLALYDSNFSLCNYLSKKDSNLSWWNGELLERAKKSLQSLSFFGLKENQEKNQLLLYHTFKQNIRFKVNYDKTVILNTKKKSTKNLLSELKPIFNWPIFN